ncbi:MAG: hypothetical protein AAGF33_07460 [Pseudomonadota bacterium]
MVYLIFDAGRWAALICAHDCNGGSAPPVLKGGIKRKQVETSSDTIIWSVQR